MRIAVIPARGESKRIPRKNIRPFAGKPAIAYPIQAAKDSNLFDFIMVSTEDREIAEVSCKWGAEVPFIRPAELANDFVGTTEVAAHATQWAIDRGWDIEAVCWIYPTAVFVHSNDLKRGLERLNLGKWLYTFAATTFAYPIFRAFQQTAEESVEMLFPEYLEMRSQDLPVALHDAGQFYWGRPQALLEQKHMFGSWSTPVIVPRWRVQDIDTEEDWQEAELMWEAIARKI